MLKPEEDIMLEELCSNDVRYILDIVCKNYDSIISVKVNTESIELIGLSNDSKLREKSFLYNSGRVVSIRRKIA